MSTQAASITAYSCGDSQSSNRVKGKYSPGPNKSLCIGDHDLVYSLYPGHTSTATIQAVEAAGKEETRDIFGRKSTAFVLSANGTKSTVTQFPAYFLGGKDGGLALHVEGDTTHVGAGGNA